MSPVVPSESPSTMGVFLSYLYKPLGFIAVLASIGLGLLYKHQDKLLYFPSIQGLPKKTKDNPQGYQSPSEHMHPFEDLYITSPDGVTFHSWLIYPKRQYQHASNKAPTILFFHGNAGNIGLRLPNAIQMCQVLHVNVLLVEYRGYGNSPGDQVRPSEAGMKLDAETVLEYCHNQLAHKLDTSKLFVFGRSLGGAVGFHLAHYAEQQQKPLAGLMVENTFLSISDMVDQVLPFLSPIKSLVLTLDWNSAVIAPRLQNTCLLYLAGLQDELVPPDHMTTLYQHSQKHSPMAQWHAVPNGTHNDTFMRGGKAYWDAMAKFMRDALSNQDDTQARFDSNEAQAEAAIPIMPGNLFGMAKEAMSSRTLGNPDEEHVKKDL